MIQLRAITLFTFENKEQYEGQLWKIGQLFGAKAQKELEANGIFSATDETSKGKAESTWELIKSEAEDEAGLSVNKKAQ